MKIAAIIPARYASSRFPGKPLVQIAGKSLIQRVYEQAQTFPWDYLAVATDDQRIFQHVQSFGGTVVMTHADHQSGTDRCAEVIQKLDHIDVIVNIQGDEPFIQLEDLETLIGLFKADADAEIATLARVIIEESELFSPDVVKLVMDIEGRALYFSRQAIPFQRNKPKAVWLKGEQLYYRHIGLYAFRWDALLAIARLSPTALEQSEALEQLRWLEKGYTIKVGLTEQVSIGIDRPEDLRKAEEWLLRQK